MSVLICACEKEDERVRVCVCVRKDERERERGRGGVGERVIASKREREHSPRGLFVVVTNFNSHVSHVCRRPNFRPGKVVWVKAHPYKTFDFVFFGKSDLYLVALLWKIIGNL